MFPLMVGIRFINYKPKKMHYFLIDFCYFGSSTVLLYVTLFPKNAVMFRCAFFYANGALAVATGAFSNALIFHQFDRLICLFTHPVPLVVIWNIRQVTMKAQKDLPLDQQKFIPFPEDETWGKAIMMNIIYPYTGYIIWAALYYIINF